MKTVAIIGRPNAGKSSLFNRILGTKDAIISDVAGTTRDVKRRTIQTGHGEIVLMDTGGIDDHGEIFSRVTAHSMQAGKAADIVLFMVDGKSPPDDDDRRLFMELAKEGKELALVVNKIDNDKEEQNGWEFLSFGAKECFFISVSHNRNIHKLLDWLSSRMESEESQEPSVIEEDDDVFDDFDDYLQEFDEDGEPLEIEENFDDAEIRVAIIGRVNVGKSSLLNALVGSARSVVSPVAGTTIDPVDETIEHEGRKYTFIDTAGIRRRSKIVGIEKWALDRSEKALDRTDVALLVLDASEPFMELDERVAGFIDKHKTACIIVLNKWDKHDEESFEKVLKEIRDRFKFLDFAPVVSISALSGKRVHKLFPMIEKVYANYSRRITTKKLNDCIREAITKHHLPNFKGTALKIKYATQFRTQPPTIALVMNKPTLHFSYERYLINRLREEFDFEGTPIVMRTRERGQREKDREGDIE